MFPNERQDTVYPVRRLRIRNLADTLKTLDMQPLQESQSKDRNICIKPCPIHYGAEWESFNIQIHAFSCTKTPTQKSSQSKKKGSWNARSVYLSLRNLNPIYKNKGYPESKVWKKHNLGNMAFSIEDFTVPEDQVKHAKEIFKRFDKRQQEKINTNDLGPAFTALNLTIKPDQLKEWADEVDEDATGFIDMNGFLIVYAKKLREDQDEKDLREAFRVLDKNKRGEIDVEDLRWILKGLGDDLTEEEIDDMIRDTDTDGSGFVDFDEFYKLMTSE